MSEPTSPPRFERLVTAFQQHIEAGNPPPDGSKLRALLIERGIPDPMLEVWKDGRVVLWADTTSQKVVGVLDNLDPVEVAPDDPAVLEAEERTRADAIKTELRSVLGAILAKPAENRTLAERAVLLYARLLRAE